VTSRASRIALATGDGSGQLDTDVTDSNSPATVRAPPLSLVGLEHVWSSAAATPHAARFRRCDITRELRSWHTSPGRADATGFAKAAGCTQIDRDR
jgi:hypothetical protein